MNAKIFVKAILSSTGYQIFDGIFVFLPRVGEELDINGDIYVIDNIRYIIRNGTHDTQAQIFLSLVG